MKKPKLSDQEKGLLKLKNDPSLFVREVLGAEPEPWQADALKASCDHDREAILVHQIIHPNLLPLHYTGGETEHSGQQSFHTEMIAEMS